MFILNNYPSGAAPLELGMKKKNLRSKKYFPACCFVSFKAFCHNWPTALCVPLACHMPAYTSMCHIQDMMSVGLSYFQAI